MRVFMILLVLFVLSGCFEWNNHRLLHHISDPTLKEKIHLYVFTSAPKRWGDEEITMINDAFLNFHERLRCKSSDIGVKSFVEVDKREENIFHDCHINVESEFIFKNDIHDWEEVGAYSSIIDYIEGSVENCLTSVPTTSVDISTCLVDPFPVISAINEIRIPLDQPTVIILDVDNKYSSRYSYNINGVPMSYFPFDHHPFVFIDIGSYQPLIYDRRHRGVSVAELFEKKDYLSKSIQLLSDSVDLLGTHRFHCFDESRRVNVVPIYIERGVHVNIDYVAEQVLPLVADDGLLYLVIVEHDMSVVRELLSLSKTVHMHPYPDFGVVESTMSFSYDEDVLLKSLSDLKQNQMKDEWLIYNEGGLLVGNHMVSHVSHSDFFNIQTTSITPIFLVDEKHFEHPVLFKSHMPFASNGEVGVILNFDAPRFALPFSSNLKYHFYRNNNISDFTVNVIQDMMGGSSPNIDKQSKSFMFDIKPGFVAHSAKRNQLIGVFTKHVAEVKDNLAKLLELLQSKVSVFETDMKGFKKYLHFAHHSVTKIIEEAIDLEGFSALFDSFTLNIDKQTHAEYDKSIEDLRKLNEQLQVSIDTIGDSTECCIAKGSLNRSYSVTSTTA
ncbi:hypothetical protein PCE1_003875 [Barthelona sp. PCE]